MDDRVIYGGIPHGRPLITESYWQRGCDDAKAGREPAWPTNAGPHDRRNEGYENGYAYGKTHYRMADVGKRIAVRAAASIGKAGGGT